MNKFLSQIGPFSTNPGYNEQKWPVPSCSLTEFVPCVPGIMAFINKDIELRIFFYLLLLHLNHFCLEFTKNLRPKHMPARILTIDIYDSHTQADKIDRLLYKKKLLYHLQFNTAYYSSKGHDPWHTLYNKCVSE